MQARCQLSLPSAGLGHDAEEPPDPAGDGDQAGSELIGHGTTFDKAYASRARRSWCEDATFGTVRPDLAARALRRGTRDSAAPGRSAFGVRLGGSWRGLRPGHPAAGASERARHAL